ncbi:uncharacterized protein LOC111704627 [Eurytemora carolleeae]|uniref:uncharacterized protein LOC111704627 n=1 Tax=Eurytemora carolleeae TaxID=1294199 RepID=UPI000C7697B4|nr:uncharacterized protein LOC111704627 [Eurytemora carolleeae]|eukprot:XP_023332685.1 uncharacterized protein LOC111704627 [Eurytemora affinis]
MDFKIKLVCLFLLNLTLGEGSEIWFGPDDFETEGFDFTVLQFLEEMIVNSPDCEDQKLIVKRYAYPLLEDGVVVNSTLDVASPTTVKQVNKVYTLLSRGGNQTYLGNYPNEYLDPPSLLPYNFQSKKYPLGDGQPLMIDQRYFQESLKGGFFIEAGAFDGELESTTLYFEQKHGWSGLLVEPLLKEYKQLREVNRKAWSVHTCLSPIEKPKTIIFTDFSSDLTGAGILEDNNRENKIVKGTEMQCLPLTSLILALGNPRVDYLSLDIEGAEYNVLKTIDWSRVDIRVISVETQFISEFGLESTDLHNLLTSQGYILLDHISRDTVYFQAPSPHLQHIKPNLPYLPSSSRNLNIKVIYLIFYILNPTYPIYPLVQ